MSGTGGQPAYANNGPGAAAFRVQNQIRQNAHDMQEYLTELGSWEKSIKKKDRKLSRNATASSSSMHKPRSMPDTDVLPVRHARNAIPVSSGPAPQPFVTEEPPINAAGTEDTPVGGVRTPVTGMKLKGGNDVNHLMDTKSSVSAAGHTYDKGYDKWAKFDIDAALRSVDQEEAETADKRPGGSSSSDSDTDVEDNQDARRLTPATMVNRSSQDLRPPSSPHKMAPATKIRLNQSPKDLEKEERERGNAKFGRGDFEGAVKSYTRCVAMNGKSSLAFSNRAMAYLKLKEFGKAEADTDAALRVDPRHVKSLQRRAVARNALGKHRAALGDLQTAAEIDPSSKQVRKDLNKTLETLKTVMRRAPKSHVKVESVSLPAPKPHGNSAITETDRRGLAPAHPTRPYPRAGNPASAISAINENAPATEDKETVAPFSSVLRSDTRANNESNLYSYQARTTVEELTEEAGAINTASPTPAVPANVLSPGQTGPLSAIPVSVASQEERPGDAVSHSSRSADRHAAVGPATETLPAAKVRAALPETTATETPKALPATGAAATDLPILTTVTTA
ncbi:unnamed protein product, partial [Hapterophycus canaliculatus]